MKYFPVFVLFAITLIACKKKTTIPVAPTVLNAVATSNTQINLSWTDNSTNETGFKVERKIGNNIYSVIGTTSADITTFSDQTVQPNTSYTYRVYAYNSAGPSLTYTNEVTVFISTIPTITTTSITNITAMSASGGGNISSDGGSQILAKGVCWSTSPNPTIALFTKTNDGNGSGSFTSNISVLNANTTYYLRAYATNASGTGYGNEVSFTTSNIDLTTGLVAYYPFTGNAGDSSGNNNHGTVTGAVLTAGKAGLSNTAYDFNGTTNTINIPLPFLGGTQNSAFTFSTRIKLNSSANSPSIWGKTLFWGEVNFYINSNNSVRFIWANSFSGNKYSVIETAPNALELNKWHDIVVVFSNSKGSIYIDGQLVTTNLQWVAQGGTVLSNSQIESVCNFAQDVNTSKMGVRATSGNWGNYLNGTMDDFRIYNRVLTQSEISYLATH